MLSRSTMDNGIARALGLKELPRLTLCALALLTSARCGLFGGIQAAGAALFAAGMCAGWHCGAMLLGCALGCATLGGMDGAWPVFACLSVWLTLCVAGSVELAPYPSRNGCARAMRRICITARGGSGDAARMALAAGAAGISNMVMTLTLAGMNHSGLIYCALSTLMGFGLTPVFAIGLGGFEAPDSWKPPAQALLLGICAAGMLGLEVGAVSPCAMTAAAALTALARRDGASSRCRSGVQGLLTGGLMGICIWSAGGGGIQAVGYALAGGALGALDGVPGAIACGGVLVATAAADGLLLNGWYAQTAAQAMSAFGGAMPVLAAGLNAIAGMAAGAVLGARLNGSGDARAARARLERCLAQERARIDASVARLTADISELMAVPRSPRGAAGADAPTELPGRDARRVELMRRINHLAADAASRRRAALERQRVDAALSREVMARLAGYGLECTGACVTADEPRRAYVEVSARALPQTTPESIERALTYVTGARFEYESGGADGMLSFRQCGALAVYGAVRRSACGRAECGDSALLTRLSDGRYLAGLSDGMGRDAPAARESHAALAAVERLLDCGIAAGQALAAVNELLMLCADEEMYATLDIALIDPANGRADMYKLGAMPSVLLSGGRASALGAYAPPFGILERVRAARWTVRLHAGDRLILLSDGVCDFSDDAQIRALTAAARALADVPPGEAAEGLMERMLRRYGAGDDAALVLVSMAQHDTRWRGALFRRRRTRAH